MYVSLDDFATLRTSRYDISADRVFSNIRTLILSDKSNSPADMHARKHYNTSMEVFLQKQIPYLAIFHMSTHWASLVTNSIIPY